MFCKYLTRVSFWLQMFHVWLQIFHRKTKGKKRMILLVSAVRSAQVVRVRAVVREFHCSLYILVNPKNVHVYERNLYTLWVTLLVSIVLLLFVLLCHIADVLCELIGTGYSLFFLLFCHELLRILKEILIKRSSRKMLVLSEKSLPLTTCLILHACLSALCFISACVVNVFLLCFQIKIWWNSQTIFLSRQ